MSCQRWFCCLCGAMTARAPAANGRALCTAHSAVALDTVPADPLESLPSMAEANPEIMPLTTGLARYMKAAQIEREAAIPPTGTED